MNLTRAFTLSLAASLLVGCQSHDDELATLACSEPALINPALWRTS